MVKNIDEATASLNGGCRILCLHSMGGKQMIDLKENILNTCNLPEVILCRVLFQSPINDYCDNIMNRMEYLWQNFDQRKIFQFTRK